VAIRIVYLFDYTRVSDRTRSQLDKILLSLKEKCQTFAEP